MRPKAFLMIALITSGIAAGALLVGSCSPSCGRPKVPVENIPATSHATAPRPSAPPPTTALPAATIDNSGRKTLFEKNAEHADCKTNPALCEDHFEMDVKKEMTMDLDSKNGISTEFCAGGCAKKRVLQWKLDW